MVYSADPKAIRDAEKELADQKYQEQIDSLDKMVERLEKYKELWDKIPDSYEKAQKALIAADLFGPDWQDKILNLDMDMLNEFSPQYNDAEQDMRDAAALAAANALQDAAGSLGTIASNFADKEDYNKGFTLRSKDGYEYGFFKTEEAARLAKDSMHALGDEMEVIPSEATAEKIGKLNTSLSELEDTSATFYNKNLETLNKIAELHTSDGQAITEDEIGEYYKSGYSLVNEQGFKFGFFESEEEAEKYLSYMRELGQSFEVIASHSSDFDAMASNNSLETVVKSLYEFIGVAGTEDWEKAVSNLWDALKASGMDIDYDALSLFLKNLKIGLEDGEITAGDVSKALGGIPIASGEAEKEVSEDTDLMSEDLSELTEAEKEVAEALIGEDGVISAVSSVAEIFAEVSPKIGDAIENGIISKLATVNQEILDASDNLQDFSDDGVINGPINGFTKYHVPRFYSGDAYANGQNNDLALTGELGEELVVHPNGTYETVGTNGAEFAKIGSNDIVFDHKQTAQLLKNGHINSRGKAYASGKFTPLSDLSGGNFDLYKSLNIIADNIPDIKNSVTKLVGKIASPKFSGNNKAPIVNITGTTFTCTGVTGEDVLKEISNSFTGLLNNAYQQVMR